MRSLAMLLEIGVLVSVYEGENEGEARSGGLFFCQEGQETDVYIYMFTETDRQTDRRQWSLN